MKILEFLIFAISVAAFVCWFASVPSPFTEDQDDHWDNFVDTPTPEPESELTLV